jgi:hypothetical protein
MASEVLKQKRFYLKTDELTQVGEFGNITPSFNNLYDVFIDFTGQRNLFQYIEAHSLVSGIGGPGYGGPGDYLALFCSEAVLPGSQIETQSIDGLRQGVTQHFATYRRYPDINLTFYSQKDYYTQEVFNAWMEFISPTKNSAIQGANKDNFNNAAYKRLKYPNSYKCDITITAFSKDLLEPVDRFRKTDSRNEPGRVPNFIEYKLKRAFPVNIVAAPLAFGNAELVKVTLTFKYDYFFIDRGSRTGDYATDVRRKDLVGISSIRL